MEERHIAVMGATGAGKTSLIRSLIGAEVGKVGHGLTSETQDIAAYPYEFGGYKIVMIDTPGFDDTYRSDHDILEQLINWLATTYEAGTRISGILYLQRITDNRTQGSTIRNLLSFRKLCGEECYKSVVLLTTFWKEDTNGSAVFESRYRELTESGGLWYDMLARGARVCKGEASRPVVLSAIMKLLRAPPATLQVQREMVDEKKSLTETSVITALLEAELVRQQQLFEARIAATSDELKAELRRQSQTSDKHLQDIKERYQQELADLQRANEDLEAKIERINLTRSSSQPTQPNSFPTEKTKSQRDVQQVDRMPSELRLQREQEYRRFNQTITTAIEWLLQGQKAGFVKCSLLPRKSLYLLACRNCLRMLGAGKHYACIACGPRNLFAICETCYRNPEVSCNVATHPKQSSFGVVLPKPATCPKLVNPPQARVVSCSICRQDVGSCYLHCCKCAETWDMCLACAAKKKYCPGHGRSFPRTPHQLEVCARYLG